jgi:hypothetical protein
VEAGLVDVLDVLIYKRSNLFLMRPAHLILLAVLPLVSGCGIVESERPLSPPRSAVRDQRLEGLWRPDGKGEAGYLYITFHPRGDGSVMIFSKYSGTGAISTAQYDFFVTRTSKHDYLNLSHGVSRDPGFWPSARSGTYIFAEYHFTWLGQLAYSMVAGDAFGKAVDAGKLRGKVQRDKKYGVVGLFLTDSSRHILDFIESSKPGDVFGAPTKLSKIGGP